MKGAQQPAFSVIIPAYNRPRELAGCLGALARQSYPRDRFEVIVVDDGSRRPPVEEVAAVREVVDVTLIQQANAGAAAASNAGAAQARGEFLAFTDDDCRPARAWLRSLAARFANAPDRAVGGRTLNGLVRNPYSAASQLIIRYLYSYYNADPECARFLDSNNVAFPAERFRAIGGFDARYRVAADDRDICDRWLRHGFRMLYAPEVVAYHFHALTFRSFWQQHFNYGRGAWQFRRSRRKAGGIVAPLEPPSFYAGLLAYPLACGPGGRRFLLSAILAVSQIAIASGFCWEAARR